MKRPTFFNHVLVVLLLLFSMQIFAQNYIPFTPRFNQDLKGDIVLIGNNILGPDNNAFNDNSVYNHNVDMQYIDIDGDASTFSSSSADLGIPNPNCYKIIHAGLYWGAVTNGTESITNVKFRGPTGGYNDIVGTVVFDANGTSVDGGNSFSYACYADVTSIVTSLGTDLGTYTVANVSSAQGQTDSFSPYNGTGYSAGWSLFIVYEDPTMPGKSITSFDGFSAISVAGGNPTLDIPVTGFRTVPAPAPVRANFAFATLEGDSPILGDQLLFNGLNLSTVDRPATNFFNSSVTQLNATPVNNRNPNSTNTLGFDTGVMVVPNPGNTVIANGATSGTVRLETSGDTYFPYFFALAVDIIEPNIVLTKVVEDALGNDIGNQLVSLGDELNYVIGFQNTGNDDATNLIIRDILPINIVFNYPADMGLLPPGVTVQSYNVVTREIVFSVDNSVVEENDPIQEIRFKVTVVQTCSLLNDACDNIISNQAFSTYNGTLNPTFTISDDPSFNTNAGCLLNSSATNFLADIDCTFVEDVILCGASTVLTAGNDYDSYSWSTSPSGTPVIGTTQSITVTTTGTYYVHNIATAPCQSIDQEFNVITFGAGVTNPLIPFADQVVTCPNDGKQLPNFFLCGTGDSRYIQTNITDTSSIIWEKLDEGSCTAVTNQDCANEDAACAWNQVETGSNYLIDTAGQYRLTLNYTGGCFNQFYFNVYTNLLVPTVTSRDIICTNPGEIVVGGVPSGYEYSIDGVTYQPSNTFSITTPNIYSVFVRQIGVTPNPCIFTVPDVQIRQRDFTVSTVITQPYCNGEKGSVKLAANDVRPQYYYSIYDGATLINSVGPIAASDYTFADLNPGTYTVNVSTDDGCIYTGSIDVIEPPLLTATSALTQPLTCTDGEITVYPVGGTAPYFYFVNSTTVFQTTPIIPVSTAGVYNITVVDSNNCSANTSITVNATPAPDFNVTKTDILCIGNSGSINVNVTNPNGNSLQYSIDNGVTFVNSPIFTGLTAGNYDVVVQYTLSTDVCTSSPQSVIITTTTDILGTATLTPFTCTTNGVITVSGVSGGTAPYTYSIDGITYQAGLTFSGLTNGTYTITIKDASNCTLALAPITIDPLNPPTDLAFSNTPLSCPANTTDVTITSTTGGTTSLEYQIIAPIASATVYQSSNVFSGLVPNTYTFQVKDANDCTYTESYAITPLVPITINTILTKDLDCTVSPDAIITGIFSGGVAPFTYAVSINGGTYSSLGTTGSPFTYSTAPAGTYQFQITDVNNCTAISNVSTVTTISLPEITSVVQTQPILCNGDSNAAIQVTINTSVGSPPFVINVNNDTTGTNYGTQTSGLPTGNYTITLTDSKSCTDTETITIAEPTPIVVNNHTVDITCSVSGISKGSVIIDNVSGGTAPYNYFVTGTNGYNASELNSSGTTSVTFDVVDFGLYQINVVDANGCSVLVQDVLVASPPNDLDIIINTTANCLTGGQADISVGTSLASAGPFFFAIYRGPTTVYPNPVGDWIPESAPGSKTANFTGLLPGVTYTFIVHDAATSCSYYETATASIPTNSTLTSSALTSNNITCKGSADGNVSFTINSVYASATNVDYEIFNSLSLVTTGITGSGIVPATASLSVTNLGPLPFGTYFVLIRETSGINAGCSVVTVPFNITESAIDLSISATVDKNANCNANSGIISAIAKDGTAPYLYQITTSATAPIATDPSWASASTFNVNANSYYVHVKDANGCIKSTLVLVLPSDPAPAIAATLNNQCTVAEGDFEIDVTLITAGIAPYSYSVDGGAFQTRTAPFTLSNLSSGTHSVEIRDANGCGNLVNVNIAPPLNLIPAVTVLPTCNDDDGEITITGSGGSGNYTYAISPNPASISLSTNVFSGVPSGTYIVTITDTTTLCTENVSITLSTPTPLTVTTVPTPVTCFGDNNGSFILNTSGYTGAYNYEVFDSTNTSVGGIVLANTSTNPQTITGLIAGNYTVVVTEIASPFCSTTSSTITIGSPVAPLILVATETSNVTCDNDKGTITAIASDGWGTYEYELTGAATVGYSSNGTFTNLVAGSYTVNVRDAGGCIISEAVTLIIPTPINATVSANTSLLSCFGDTNATITASVVTGGQGSSYSYTLNMISPTVSTSGPQTNPVFSGLGAGTYNVVVTDGYNCSFTSPDIVIAEPSEIEATLVKVTSQTCLTSSSLTLSATGGTGLYSYSATSTFTTVLGTFTSSDTFSVTPGTYTYYVRDVNGCTAIVSNEIKIDPLPTLVVNLDSINPIINCSGDNSGVITAIAQGGLGSYVYTLQDGSGTNIIPAPTQTTPGVFSGLSAGTYQVRVDSGDCLLTSATINITEPTTPLTAAPVVTNVTCNGTNNGVLQINASGGTGIIKYAISPQLNQFFETSLFEDLAPGTYQAIAQDVLGCFQIIDFTISEPTPIILTIVPNSILPELCEGDLNGEFSIEISGGNLPYSVSLDDVNGVYTTGTLTQTQFDFMGLSGEDHTVFVRDALGCESEWNITFPKSVNIDPIATIVYGCTNNASTNTVTVTVDSSITDLSDLDYSLNGGTYQASNEFINVAPGTNHFIDVRHTNGCIKRTDIFEITTFDPLALVLEDGGLNEIVAVTTGGSGVYQYTLNGVDYGSTNTFIISESGDYTVTVTDSNGCTVSATKYFEFIDVCIPNYFTPNGDGVLDEWAPGCTINFKDLTFDIFDRYGRKVATMKLGQKWNGKYNGKELPTGDYWYVIKLNDKKDDREFVGNFTLYR